MVSLNVNISTLSCYSWNTNVGVFSLSNGKIWTDILQFWTFHSLCPSNLCWADNVSMPTTKWLRVRFGLSKACAVCGEVCLLGHSCISALPANGVKAANFYTYFWSSLGGHCPLKILCTPTEIVCVVRICGVWKRLHYHFLQSRSKQIVTELNHLHDMTPHCWAEEIQENVTKL